MKNLFQKSLVLIIVVTMLTSCATMNDSTRTKAEGTAAGVGIGALIGAGAGYLLGGKDGAKFGAIAGATVGGALGFGLGSTVADRKQKYANEEERLNGEISVAARYNEGLRNYNVDMEKKIVALQSDIDELKSQYASDKNKRIAMQNKQQEMKKLISKTDAEIASKKKELVALNDYCQSLKGTQNTENVAKLENEIGILQNNIAQLDRNNAQMAKLVNSLNISK